MEQRDLLKSLMKMLMDLQLYKSLFEPRLVTETQEFYREESTQKMQGVEASQDPAGVVASYLTHVAARIREEQARCGVATGYLDVGSRKELISIVEDKLIRQNVGTLLSKGRQVVNG